MKKITLFLLSFLPFAATAENIVQFTGGNYIYAETGKLIFNIEPKIFEARSWQYNPQTDAAETYFKVNMQLKTRYTSEFHGYEATLKNKFHTVAMQNRAAQWQNVQLKPVYQQKAFLPAAGWFIGVGGTVARSVLPPVITNCIRSLACNVTTGVVAGHCVLNMLTGFFYNVPYGICEKAEADGWVKQPDGTYKRMVHYKTRALGGLAVSLKYNAGFSSSTHDTAEAAKNAILSHCSKINSSPAGELTYDGYVETHVGNIQCNYSVNANASNGYIAIFSYGKYVVDESMTMIDLQNYASEDFKEKPSDYINAEGPIGEGLRAVIKSDKADIRNGSGQGTFSVIGSQSYRDPKTGKTVQDTLTIQSAHNSGNGQLSGTAAEKAPGVSSTTNNVTVNQIERPDKEAESSPGKENSPNGTNPGSSSGGSGTGSEGEGEEDGEKCKENDDTLACAKLGTVDESENPFVIPDSEDDTTWEPDFFLPSGGSCPAPKSLSLRGYTIQISYDPMCQFAERIRFLMIALASVAAGFIVFGRKV